MSALDPTCGSGAFLLGAMRMLEPLYEICLELIEAAIDEAEKKRLRDAVSEETIAVFRHAIEGVTAHSNCRCFIIKSIVERNLYGVDSMPEAVEICRMMMLRLPAEVTSSEQLERLSGVRFNIRAGNALVGYVNEVNCDIARDEAGAFEDVQQHFVNQPEKLNRRLNERLAKEYGVAISHRRAFQAWLESHKPFHWAVEFRDAMSGGGFDMIIGNPPYLSARIAREQYDVVGYRTASCLTFMRGRWRERRRF